MQADFTISLAEYKSISSYKPKVGDFIIWHGWFTHYYGVISGVDSNKVKIVKAGLPTLLFTMETDEMEKNSKIVNVSSIRRSKGSFSANQGGIWYV